MKAQVSGLGAVQKYHSLDGREGGSLVAQVQGPSWDPRMALWRMSQPCTEQRRPSGRLAEGSGNVSVGPGM